ncbi:MAG: histidine--tRNA ligase [Bacteroidales bacterium]|nr:histidine--tRNA ligase [Bacteroidales bacterium]
MDPQPGIVPRKIKGFRDIGPQMNELRWHIIRAAAGIYRLYGFEHWDTPLLEYADNLGKYLPDADTVEEGIYSFHNPEAEPMLAGDGREIRNEWDHVVMNRYYLALRYDLTAPLARLYAERLWNDSLKGGLSPDKAPLFRRYQYGPVFRYEYKLDPGRFREFWQVDFDTVGSSDQHVDAEACMILSRAMEAIGLPADSYQVKVNNRKILKGFLSVAGIPEQREDAILRVIDKLDKIGLPGIESELGKGRPDASGAFVPGLNLGQNELSRVMAFLEKFSGTATRTEVLSAIRSEKQMNNDLEEGLNELQTIHDVLNAWEMDETRIVFDPSLVRGMSYYTGPVFEVVSDLSYTDHRGRQRKVGSICGGGRYDGLVERLLGMKIPASGASIGVDRLAELLMMTGQYKASAAGPVLILVFDTTLLNEYHIIAHTLREAGIDTEIYFGAQKGLKKQMAYADRKNSPFAVLMGEDELKKGSVTVKDLRLGRETTDIKDKEEWKNRVQSEIPRDQLIGYIREHL